MNYRHIYHAGNRADIIKHLALVHLLARLTEKPAPLCVMDTHAATGLYDLQQVEAQKTKEAMSGVHAFMRLPFDPAIAPLQKRIAAQNSDGAVRFYPGSPALVRHYLRPQDRFLAAEKHPEDAQKLQRYLRDMPNAHVHVRDAWEAMQALLPPPEKRAIVFIDPPFEKTTEFDDAFNAMCAAHKRMSHGVYALWYPIKDVVSIGHMQERFAASGIKKILRADVPFTAQPKPGALNGCGLIILNPPWKLDNDLRSAYQAILPMLDAGAPTANVDWLVA